MSVLQMVLIALFIYLGAIGSIVGNTIGWYCLGRPLVASFVVGLIMGDVQTALLVTELACMLRARGQTLHDALDALYADCGCFDERTVSLSVEGDAPMERMAVCMNST